MFFVDDKLKSRIEEMAPYRYRDVIQLETLLMKEDNQMVPNPVVPDNFEEFEEIKTGMFWSGRDRYLWLHRDVVIPMEWAGKKVVGVFDFGNTGGGNNSGFESMLYMDKKPYQGVDSNHKEVFFGEEAVGKSKSLTFRLWSGLEGGGVPTVQEHRIKRAELAWLDEKVDDLYYLSLMMLETLKKLDDGDPVKHNLRSALDAAFARVDWSYPGSEAFYQSLHEADELLNERLDSMDKNSLVTVGCVGHTHIDVAWLWRLKHTREKASRSFSTVLRLMEQFGEYIFLQTQPQIYEYIKQDFPEIFAEIKKKVKEGRWEVDGAMWVEADCNLTSGESLTRQILIGSKFVKEEFDKDMEYLWLPDVFGYSWALPQILKKSGINTFMTTKISWNEYNRMPHDTFKWVGMDGSEVLTHFVTTPEENCDLGPWFYTYNGMLTPYTVNGVWDGYNEKNVNKEVLISYGFGDGGGGVNREALEQRRRMDKIPGLPNVKTTTAGDYFKRLQETFKNTDQYVHTWDGELYLEYHRGTYTSQAYNKKMNRKMEFLYREAEWMTVMAAIQKGCLKEAGQERLTKGWKILLRNQFHDIIPGSSIREVYEDSKIEYKEAEELASEVEAQAVESLFEKRDNTVTVINNSGWMRSGIAAIEESREGVFVDTCGNILESQRMDGYTYVEVKDIPSMGGKTVIFKEEKREPELSVFTIDKNHVETPYYSIEINPCGQITRIYDKENSREVLQDGERANVLQMFEDKPLKFDAWNLDIFYQEKMKEISDLTSIEVVENGNLRAVLRMEWKYMSTTVKQDMVVYAKNRRIDFVTKVDYHERRQLMKAAFPVNIRTTSATYDIQYGNVKRPNHWNTSWDQAKFETVAHRYVDLSEYGYGVSLLNDCKYGHDVKENVMRITLLKSGMDPDHEQDQGQHEFTYSLYPHQGDFVEAGTVMEAYSLNQPLKIVDGVCAEESFSFLDLNNNYVELDAIKQSEDKKSLVIRFHEFAGSSQKVKVNTGFAYQSWTECDLMERPLGDFCQGKEIEVMVTPYEIKTILIRL